jgi:hypothetical protein
VRNDYSRVLKLEESIHEQEPYQSPPKILINQEINPAIAGIREAAPIVYFAFLLYVPNGIARGVIGFVLKFEWKMQEGE